jgi:hypothetical protein
MPSEEMTRGALDALQATRAAFRAALMAGDDQIRGYLAAHRAHSEDRTQLAALELGRFAGGRLDSGRFASVVTGAAAMSVEAEGAVRRCVDLLTELLARGDALFTCVVPPGGDLRQAVEAAYADRGRAFGAALVFRAVRSGAYRPAQHDALLDAYPFARWSRSERAITVPLVVQVSGADLRANALAEYVDGHQKILLVIDGPCSPAPLVRLVTPGVFVQQATTPGELAALDSFQGAGIGALVPETAAQFVHAPLPEQDGGSRLTISRLPAVPPRGALGGWSSWQQREELAQLQRLAQPAVARAPSASAAGQVADAPAIAQPAVAQPAVSAAAAAAPSGAAPPRNDDEQALNALTGWLLAQAGLGGTAGATG